MRVSRCEPVEILIGEGIIDLVSQRPRVLLGWGLGRAVRNRIGGQVVSGGALVVCHGSIFVRKRILAYTGPP